MNRRPPLCAYLGEPPGHVLDFAGIHLFEDGDGFGQERGRKTAKCTFANCNAANSNFCGRRGFRRHTLQKVIQTCHAVTPAINSDNASVSDRWLR